MRTEEELTNEALGISREVAREAWCTDLESGAYKQETEALQFGDAYCCLGVATRVFMSLTNLSDEEARVIGLIDNSTKELEGAYALNVVRRFFGLKTRDGKFLDAGGRVNSLALLNDVKNLDFIQIAEVIRSKPEGLFGD